MSLYIQEKEEVAEAQKLLQSSAEMDMIFSSTVRASISDDSVWLLCLCWRIRSCGSSVSSESAWLWCLFPDNLVFPPLPRHFYKNQHQTNLKFKRTRVYPSDYYIKHKKVNDVLSGEKLVPREIPCHLLSFCAWSSAFSSEENPR